MSEPYHILLVEDNRGDAELIGELIKDTGIAHSLTWLDDGEKAIEFFDKGGKADLVILDLNLPIVSGHEIMRFIRSRGISTTTPVVILTGSDSPLDMETAKKNGVVCYFIKPMTIDEMDQMTKALGEIILGSWSCNC